MNSLVKSSIMLIILDSIFIYFIKGRFNNQIQLVQNSPMKIDFISAILTYILLIFALYYFIIKENKSEKDAFILGFCIYGVYELTTKSLLEKWSYETVIIDTLWGGVLFCLTTYLIKLF